jgi:cytidylate kinase
MITQPSFERCQAFINCQLQPGGRPTLPIKSEPQWRAVTISRQTGSGAHVVAEELAKYLQTRTPGELPLWTVFDRNLVEKVLEEHHLPDRMARFLAEDRISEIEDTMDELFGLHPPSWTLVRQTAETILHLVELGKVIIIGRGAGIITRNLDYVFHARLVGSLEKRVQHVQEFYKLGGKAAIEFIHKEDRGRRRYLKKYLNREIDDPLLYHAVINTDLVPYVKAARMIGDALLCRPVVSALAQERR